MEISLRKAALIQSAIGKYLSQNARIGRVTEIRLFQDPAAVLEKARVEANTEINKYLALTQCRADIRRLVGRANTDCLVSDMLADVAGLNTTIEFLECALNTGSNRLVARPVEELQRMLNKMEAEESTSYGGTEIATGVMTEEMVADLTARLNRARREKNDLQESIAERNASAKIKLPEATAELLKVHGFL